MDPRHESKCVEMINYFMFREHMCLVFPKYGLSLYDFIKKNKYKGFLLNDIKDIAFQIIKCISCKKEPRDLCREIFFFFNTIYLLSYSFNKFDSY